MSRHREKPARAAGAAAGRDIAEGHGLTNATRTNGRRHLTFGSDNQKARDKLRELVLYIAGQCENDETFGAVKLNKILFYADFISFAEYGEPITGVRYKKYSLGPVPTILKRVREEMKDKGEIVIRNKAYYGGTQHRLIPVREPDFSKLKARDIALVDYIIRAAADHSGREMSKLSHDRAWSNASEGEAIPYEAAFVSDEPLTERDIAIADDMIAEYERFEQSRERS